MSEHEPSLPPKTQQAAPAGDSIETIVGKDAHNVAVGKNIKQFIIDKFDLPPWLLSTIAASFVVVAVVALVLLSRALWGGIRVVVQPEPTALAVQPTEAPPLCPPNRTCVLVADFLPEDNPDAPDMTLKIRDALASEDLLPSETFAVRAVTAVNDAADARRIALREHALIVVWGQVLASLNELTINFALTDQLGVGESRQVRPYRAESFAGLTQKIVCLDPCFEQRSMRRTMLDQISNIVAYTAAGMLHYANDQPEEADDNFLAALYCSGQIADGQAPSGQQPKCDPNLAMDGFNPASIYYYAGKSKVLTGDYAKAIDFLLQAAEGNQADPASWIGIASAYDSWLYDNEADLVTNALQQAKQRTDALRAEMVKRGDAKSELAAADYELGFIAELGRDWQSAQTHYNAAVDGFGAETTGAYVVLTALERVQRYANQPDAAATTLQQAIALDEQAPWAYLELALAYRGQRTQAEQQLEAARAAAPNQAYVDIVQADLCASESWADYECAAAAFERALAKRPDSGWLHNRVGDFYRLNEAHLDQSASRQQAIDHYKQAVALRPNDPWPYTRLAYMEYVLGDYASAVSHYETALTLVYDNKNAAAVYCPLGSSQEAAGDIDAAKASYTACAEQGNENESAWANSQLERLWK